jgi:hypothetical protein
MSGESRKSFLFHFGKSISESAVELKLLGEMMHETSICWTANWKLRRQEFWKSQTSSQLLQNINPIS